MILEILKYPDPRLAKVSEPVEEITEEIKQLALNMIETMYKSDGIGLAAPQIGRNIRMLVMDPFHQEQERNPRVFINPELQLEGDIINSEKEGCLSVPLGFRADVPRSARARVRGRDIDGKEIDELLEGLPAIVIQHETDHLDGKLFIDRISHLRRTIYDGKVKKWQKASA